MQAAGQSTKPATESSVQPTEVPDHELLGLVGRGAYGEVWLARNAIGTFRAVKIVHRQSFQRVEDFEREFKGLLKFEPISRSHDGLVDVLQIGRRYDAGYFFYVMELADAAKPCGEDGRWKMENGKDSERGAHHPPSSIVYPQNYIPHTLRSELQARTRLPPAECVTLGLKLAAALEHLHANGLVHRDVKPSNIIFVNGEPKLADIGLVTAIDEAQSLVGTVGYIPPEGPGTPQADLYSFGKVLYEIAFGKDRQEFPQLPADLQSHPDYTALLELNEIILKACETDPRLRYQSATALRKDLTLLQNGNSVRSAHQVERRWRTARRGAAWLTVTAALALVVLASRVRPISVAPRIEKRSTNEVANGAYDQGCFFLNQSSFQVATSFLNQAIQADPNFGQAYAYLALAYAWSGRNWNPGWILLPEAKATALHALKLDRTLAIPHVVLGCEKAMIEWSWDEAEKEFKEALRLDRDAFECHHSYGEFLRMRGHTNEALKQINEAKKLQPLSVAMQIRYVFFLLDARQFDEALTQVHLLGLAGVEPQVLCALGNYRDAIKREREFRSRNGESKENLDRDLGELERTTEANLPKAYWARWLKDAKNLKDPYEQACAYAQLGETEEAINWLVKCSKDRNASLTFHIKTDWRLDPVRSKKEFQGVLKAMHLK